MITKTLAILALLSTMSTQPVQPTADAEKVPPPQPYYCLTEPVDWPHLPEWDNCIERQFSQPRNP